jgi:hypothetical protein
MAAEIFMNAKNRFRSVRIFGQVTALAFTMTGCSSTTTTGDAGAGTPVAEDAGTSEQDAAGGSCSAPLETDPLNCGSCGHSCLGGTCNGGICQPRQVAAFDAGNEPVSLTVDDDSIYWLASRHVLFAPKRDTTPGQKLFDVYYTFLPSHALRSNDHAIYVYTADCCDIANVTIFDRTTKAVTSAGNVNGNDTLADVLLDGTLLVAKCDAGAYGMWAMLTTPDNEEGKRDTFMGTPITALASNVTTIFFGMKDPTVSTRAIGKFEKSAVSLVSRTQFSPSTLTQGPWQENPTNEFSVLAANSSAVYAFAADGAIFSISPAGQELTKIADDASGVAVAAEVDDAAVCWASASAGNQSGAIECLAAAPGSSVVKVATLADAPRSFAMDAVGLYWSTAKGVWALARLP